MARRVAVVGGGVTGLAAAHALAARAAQGDGSGVEVTLLEASDRLGGKVRTERVDGMLFECGPDALFLRSPFALDLCRGLGLGDQVVRADPRHRRSYVLFGGRLHAIPAGMEGGVPRAVWPMASSGLLSPLGKLRAALEVALPAGRTEADESVDAFVRRRFGPEVAERVAGPLLGAIYNDDARRLSLLATAPHLRAAERRDRSLLLGAWRAGRRAGGHAPAPNGSAPASPFVSLRCGLDGLVERLAAGLAGVDVRLGAAVRALRPEAGGFLLETDGGERLVADRVVLAVPAYEAARLLEPLSFAAAAHLAAVRYASSIVVALAFPATVARALPPGSGFVVAPGEPRLLAACSWLSRKWPHCAPNGELVVRGHVKPERRPDAASATDAELVAGVRGELRDLFGLTAAPLAARVYRWPRALPSYAVGHLDRLAAVERALGDLPGLVLAGAGYRGAGVPECLRQGVEAAERAMAGAGWAAAAPAAAAAQR